ncbi:MAG TPA: ATP-binding cassette domain-containing protein [Longimicrobiaceae bacterium]|nr:ATP-binding cassette domain-containing protein [Longimicrobiaceae bacterium]
MGGEAHHRRRRARRDRRKRGAAVGARRPGAERRPGRRAPGACLVARRVAPGRPLLEPRERAHHGARRDAGPRAVRGPGDVRPPRAGAPADDRPDRPPLPALRDGAGRHHPGHAGRRARRVQPGAPPPAGARRSPQLPGRDPLRRAQLFAPLPAHAGAPRAGLPALRGRERRDGQGGPDVRSRAVARRALRRPRPALLRGECAPLGAEGDGERTPLGARHPGLLRRLRHHPPPRGRRGDQRGNAHLPCGRLHAQPRPHPAAPAGGERHLRAEPQPRRPLRLLRPASDRLQPARRAAGPAAIQRGFVFEDVGFRYEGSERWAVRHVSFEIRPGERVALVGENGAGKTTLTKLIARLYDPTEGRILLDGRDLREYDLASARRAIGVIFQDFVRYDLRFDENVGAGEIEMARGYIEALNEAKAEAVHPREVLAPITAAAERSLASSLLPRFASGYRQMLGRRFAGGVELSGGEWQKVALARAYMREAQLLILDEPTAALDARAEYEVFLRFSELMEGRMAIIISHRFSTVRMADRILVLGGGRVVEEGTHEILVARGGAYSELFEMQAAGYR